MSHVGKYWLREDCRRTLARIIFRTGFFLLLVLPLRAHAQVPIELSEILGRPTSSAVTTSVLFGEVVQVYYEYGTSPGQYTVTTPTHTSVPGEPFVAEFVSLQPNTRYYYRTCYKRPIDLEFTFGNERTFHTQRSPGSSFSFTIEADPHPYDKKGSHSLWRAALQNQLNDSADFLIDLGDTFGDDHNPFGITSDSIRLLRHNARAFFGLACHSLPLFLCLGNHEGENGYYLLQTPPNNLAVQSTLWRKFYFPNPVPDDFYLGNTISECSGVGLPENYYAWEWGDALFVVLDAYRGFTSSAKPRGWNWTLGKEQYDWFKQTLESSQAPFKFVFAHHVLGETRGGSAVARFYEWGGYDGNGTTWGFSGNRPGWSKPIHQLMVDNGVGIFFQGHDHLFAREVVDGVVYQTVPMPSDSTYVIGVTDNGADFTDLILDGSGHLRVTVSSGLSRVDYVRAVLPQDETSTRRNGDVAHTYDVTPRVTAVRGTDHRPATMILEPNYPNPFNPTTVIRYFVRERTNMDVQIVDLLGREVVTLVHEEVEAGSHEVMWNAHGFPSGVYLVRAKAAGWTFTRPAVLAK